MDPGLVLTYDNQTGKFTVEAKTGVAVWTWLDYPEGPLLFFDDNAFLLLPGVKREVGYVLERDAGAGEWVEEVTVGSLWDNKVA